MTARLDSFATAILRFSEALSAPETDLTRDAAIQRFEFCFELAWKVIQERARLEGLDCQSPKGCLKLAYKNGWIDEEAGWLAMLEDPTRTAPPTHMTKLSPKTCIAASPPIFLCCKR